MLKLLTLLQDMEQSSEAMSHLQVPNLPMSCLNKFPHTAVHAHQVRRHGQHLIFGGQGVCAALLIAKHVLHLQLNPTSAGDSAPYPRRASSQDDVVIVSALRTPVCKVLPGS